MTNSLSPYSDAPQDRPGNSAVEATVPSYILDALTDQMREVLDHQYARPHLAADGLSPLEAMRADYRDERTFWNQGGPQMEDTDHRMIHAGGKDIAVRVHRPVGLPAQGGHGAPAIVFFHGGGYSMGDLNTHDRIQRMLADNSGAIVVAVDYSLSPEARFPQALHECADVVAELAVRGNEYGIDGSRLALAGDSAGAALSVSVTLLLRDAPEELSDPSRAERALEAIRALVLYYGGYGLRDSISGRLFGGPWDGLGQQDREQIYTTYYAEPAHAASPLVNALSADLDDFPPAYIVSAALDPLRDDSTALAALLARAGSEVQYRRVDGVLHSFLHFGRMLDEANEVLVSGAHFARERF